jgi:hypothetical protein
MQARSTGARNFQWPILVGLLFARVTAACGQHKLSKREASKTAPANRLFSANSAAYARVFAWFTVNFALSPAALREAALIRIGDCALS